MKDAKIALQKGRDEKHINSFFSRNVCLQLKDGKREKNNGFDYGSDGNDITP